MFKTVVFLSAVSVLSLAACSHQAAAPSMSAAEREQKAAEQESAEKAWQEKMQQQEKAFSTLNEKMNEYQDLQVICERIRDARVESELKAVCERVLKERRRELLDLSDRLEEQQR
jgi:type VI protein secretion system component VasF